MWTPGPGGPGGRSVVKGLGEFRKPDLGGLGTSSVGGAEVEFPGWRLVGGEGGSEHAQWAGRSQHSGVGA